MHRFRVLTLCVGLAAGSSVMLAADKGDAAKGKAVFEQCGVCHNPDSDEKKMGPGLKGLLQEGQDDQRQETVGRYRESPHR